MLRVGPFNKNNKLCIVYCYYKNNKTPVGGSVGSENDEGRSRVRKAGETSETAIPR